MENCAKQDRLVGPTAPELTTQFAGPGGELFSAVTWAGFNLASFLEGSGVAVAPSFYLLQRALVLLLALCLAVSTGASARARRVCRVFGGGACALER